MNDVAVVGSVVERPVVGGFVCDVNSSVEWIRTVERVWMEYYKAVASGRVDGSLCGDRGDGTSGTQSVCCDCVGDVGEVAGGAGGGVRSSGAGVVPESVGQSVGSQAGGACEDGGRSGSSAGGSGFDVGSGSGRESVRGSGGSSGGEAGVAGGSKVSGAGVDVLRGPNGGVSVGRGPKYFQNQARREDRRRRKNLQGAWRPGLGSSGAVVAVGVPTSEELEARRTLALRRAAENKVAVQKAEYQLKSWQNTEKTAALERLAAERIAQKINEAKAKSQASYKKCDKSLNSLGSAGSAGEFALKKEVQAAKDEALVAESKRKYLEQQLEVAMKYVPNEGIREICELPEPNFEAMRVDDCGLNDLPEGLSASEKAAYYSRAGDFAAAEAVLAEEYGF